MGCWVQLATFRSKIRSRVPRTGGNEENCVAESTKSGLERVTADLHRMAQWLKTCGGQWLQKLHTFGLLNNSFRPAEEIQVLRTYLRQPENLVAAGSTCIQHMQKTLTQMNVQLANVISDLNGVTGMAILRAIVAGERDPQRLSSQT